MTLLRGLNRFHQLNLFLDPSNIRDHSRIEKERLTAPLKALSRLQALPQQA